MHIVFYNRDFTIMPDTPRIERWKVDRYSVNVMGGPDTMSASAPVMVDKWEVFNLLRCPVEVYDEDMAPLWWGFINKVSIPHGRNTIILSLDDMANSVSVSYSTVATTDAQSEHANTAEATNAMSVIEFGTKQKIVTLNEATASAAEQRRATYLALYGTPVQETDIGSGGQSMTIECAGWWSSLAWKYYTSTSTSTVDTITLAGTIITTAGQFINDVLPLETSGVSVLAARNPYDGQKTALTNIQELLSVGNTSGARMFATVTKDRDVVIKSEPAEDVQYLINEDGTLETITGRPIPTTRGVVGVWARLKNAPAVVGTMTAIRALFIDSAEYSGGKISFTFAGERNLLTISEVR